MLTISNRIASVATLALAFVPMLALSGAAHAAPMTLKVGDLSTAAGVSAFEQRLDRVANNVCKAQTLDVGTRIVRTEGCVEAVRAEAMDKLTDAQRSQIAASGVSTLAAR